MTLLPLLGRRVILVTLPRYSPGVTFYCLVAHDKAYAAWKTAATIESLDGRTLDEIVGNVWTWATANHYYAPTPSPGNARPEGVILSLAWAVNEGRPIASYFATARISDEPFTTLHHWIPMQIQLLPQWSSSTNKEYEVTAWAYPEPTSWESGSNGGFFQFGKTSSGQWQIGAIGTGP